MSCMCAYFSGNRFFTVSDLWFKVICGNRRCWKTIGKTQMSQWSLSQSNFFFFLSAQSQSGKAEESFEWKVNWVRQWFLINILYPVLPLPSLFLLLPFFPLFQINRVALIQCVSCRLPRRLFDPVFQSLPLGQTCFSSVCCTPALEAAAALRQTMGCCVHLTPPFLPVALTFSLFFEASLSLSLLTVFFFSFVFSPSLCLSLTHSASLWSCQSSPPSAWASRIPGGREEARTSAKQPSLEEKREKHSSWLSLSVSTVDVTPLKKK